jgi:hypothetical protein
MKVELIMNGAVKVVMVPENELEKIALNLLSKCELQSTEINSQIQILDKIVHDGLIIQSKKQQDGKV